LLGKLPANCKLLALSRIKRWWMAPNFCSSVHEVPVETQLLLIELPSSSSSSSSQTFDDSLGSNNSEGKQYAVIAPLIDFESGFRVTLFGGREGGNSQQIAKGNLAARVESGDPLVLSSFVESGLYVAAGSNPFELMDVAMSTISKRMGTFRVKKEKPLPTGIDTFGFCTWDAFYSSVDSDKVFILRTCAYAQTYTKNSHGHTHTHTHTHTNTHTRIDE